MLEKRVGSYEEDFGFHSYFEEDTARQYPCNHCQTAYITNHQTANDVCVFCGRSASQAKRIDNILSPAKVIPFLVPKKKADKIYKQWCQKVKFSPKDFGKEPSPTDLSCLYIPVILCDAHAGGNATLEGINTEKIKEEGKKKKEKQTHFYKLARDFDMEFRNLPISATKHVSQKALEALQPYRFSDLWDYSPNMLRSARGLPLALSKKELQKQINDTLLPCIDEYLTSQISEYKTVRYQERNYDISVKNMAYIWLPVFYGKFDYQDTEHIFIMNGQSGKVAFNPPVSKIKVGIAFGILTTFLFLLLRIITVLFGGPLL